MARIGIEITSRCNMACAMCSHPVMKRAKMDMPWDRIVRIVDDIERNGHELRSLQLMGEPVIGEYYPDILVWLKEKHIPVTNAFYTNALALTPERTDYLISCGFIDVHKNCEKVWVGIDTMDPEQYVKLRGGDFDQVVRNAEYFCKRMKGRLPGLAVQRMQTKWNPNEPIKAFKRFGVPVATRRVGRHAYKDRDLCVIPFTKDRRPQCKEHWGTLYIGSHGGVTSCCIDAEFEHEIGNIDDMTINQLIAARKAQQQAFKNKDYSALSLCDRCTGMEPAGI